jgi:biotin carboxyl carrier protein
MKKKYILYMAVLLVLAMATWVFAADNLVEEKSVLAGTVIADKLAVAGQAVKEGDVLVKVDTITGSAAAARATVDGTVRSVLVMPGNHLKPGDVVVKIEAAHK